ncbi:hypothetical protein TrRE_jg7140 [Triparma retinervis]|uniref:Uncharacterized protein n=1 Tax=Triparma retinervis TaxID=2557542 RepID=A0A9W7EF26_9STRA|nr:hypothetical protein TrRE_jg7140 [Triparma retinervis]
MPDLSPASDWVKGNSKLKEVTKKYRKDKGKGVESVTLNKATKKQSDGIRQIVRKLKEATPVDEAGHWELKLLLEQQKDTSAQMALVQSANRNMNVRRAQIRQDIDKKRMHLDKKNIFTKHANETRMNSELTVKIHRDHNLKKVLKDVKVVSRRRRGIAPGAATDKIVSAFTPKIPPKYKVMEALLASQSERQLIDDESLRAHHKLIKRATTMKRMKRKTGGAILMETDLLDDMNDLSDDEEEFSVASSLGFNSVGQLNYEDKSALVLPPLPSLEERYGLGTSKFSSEPVCLKYKDVAKSLESLEEQLKEDTLREAGKREDDDSSNFSISSVYTNHTGVESFGARQLKKRNLMLLKYMQIPDPRINTNDVRKKAAKSRTSMVDVEKFVQVEEDSNDNNEDVMKELQRWFHHNGLGVGPESNVIPFTRRANNALEADDFRGRMRVVWDCCSLLPVHLRMDTDLLFVEVNNRPKEQKTEKHILDEYCQTFELAMDGLFHLQVMALKHEVEKGLEELIALEGHGDKSESLGKKKENAENKNSAEEKGEDEKAKKESSIASCLPSETIVFLMNNDLYMSPVPELTPCQWIQSMAKATIERAIGDLHRISVLSEQLGNYKVKGWAGEARKRFIDGTLYGIPKKQPEA